jgi:hypothetical protein
MSVIQVGLVDTTGQLDTKLVQATAAALNVQVIRDLAQFIQGVAVSDFITPRFYDPVATPSARYSYAGHILRPRQILPGGYISFTDPSSNSLQQILFLGPKPVLKNLGPASGASLRAFSDGKTYVAVRKSRKPNSKLSKYCVAHRQIVEAAATERGSAYRQLNKRRRGGKAV